jgi:hypothetical protein
VEGDVNRLKTVKRQMYGRAGLHTAEGQGRQGPLTGLSSEGVVGLQATSSSKVRESPFWALITKLRLLLRDQGRPDTKMD